MEQLTLPGAPGLLWRTKRDVIHSLPDGPKGVKVQPHLGGGTVLAARWKHRGSMDIDIFMPGRGNLADLQLNDENNIVARLGGTAEDLKSSHITVGFGDSILDLSTVKVQPEEGHKRALVDGQEEIVLSNSQILRGKLERTTRLLVRDVFDFLVAQHKDPRALAAAVNMLPTDRVGMIQWAYSNANEHFAERYQIDITGVPERTPSNLNYLGDQAAEAIVAQRYEELTITVNGPQLVIEKRTAQTVLEPEIYDADNGRYALVSSGVAGYLDEHGVVATTALEYAIEATAIQEKSRTVYRNGDAETVAYIKECARVATPPIRPSTREAQHTPRSQNYER